MARAKRDRILDQYEKIIRTSMARTLWVGAWASWVENLSEEELAEQWDAGTYRGDRPGAGGDWDDHAPETPQGAHQAARDLAELFGKAENIGRTRPMTTLYDMAMEAHTGQPTEFGDFVDLEVPRAFGHDLTMEALGTGVSWFDHHKEFDLEVPSFEIHFTGESLTWSGRVHDNSSKSIYEHYAQYSYSNVRFVPDGFQRTLAALKIKLVPSQVMVGATKRLTGYPVWLWSGKDIEIVTSIDPITGAVADPDYYEQRGIDKAGRLGLRGSAAKVRFARDLIGEFVASASYDDEAEQSPTDYYARFPIEPAPLRKNTADVKCTDESHAILKGDPAKWAELEEGGVKHLKSGGVLEFRHCPRCHSTLSVKRMGPPPGVPRQNPRRHHHG